MTLQADIALNVLRAAVQSQFGIRLRVDPISPVVQAASRAKQILYRFKQENSDFANLIIKFDNLDPEHYLWIYPSSSEGSS